MDLAEQIDALMAEHKLKTAHEMELVQRLDYTLLDADTHIIRQLDRIQAAHDERRQDAISRLMEIHESIAGRAWTPPIEERFAEPLTDGRSRTIANAIMDQIEGAFH